MNNKRITSSKNYTRPTNTFQDTLSKQDIKDKLKEYKKCLDISSVSIGTHLRYFTVDKNTKAKVFRLGGTLNKIDPELRFVILSNGQLTWSVQINNTEFWQKISESELREELKEQIKKELIMTTNATEEYHTNMETENTELKNKNKNLKEENENLENKIKILEEKNKNLERKNNSLSKQNNQLNSQLDQIAMEIKNKKKK